MSSQQSRLYPKSSSAFQITGKALPFNDQAERSVLGSILLNDQIIPSVAEIITSEDFYRPSHQIIFRTMLALIRDYKRVDLITVQNELSKSSELASVGGVMYLVGLQEEIPAIGLAEQHATIIREKSVLRQLINSASSIIKHCYEQDEKTLDAVLDNAEKAIFEIANKRDTSGSFVQLNIWLKKTFQHLSDIKSNNKGIIGIPSGYEELDAISSGFQSGDFVVLAARPSMGKTALSLSMASFAANQGKKAGYFSLEMAAEQLTLRLLSGESGIAHQKIRNATISSEEWAELTDAAGRMYEMCLYIDDTALMTIMELRTKARRLKAEHGLDIIFVDYLQLLSSSGRYENRHQEVSVISRGLKALAKELSVPVVALSQLSRAVDSRVDKRPMLSDLRESGAIEQDADLIMFLYRDVVYNPETEHPDLTELIVGKQRNGPTGTVYLQFERELTRFHAT